MRIKPVLNACPTCGAFHLTKKVLCSICEAALLSRVKDFGYKGTRENLKSFSLFLWKSRDKLISKWLYSLKGDARVETYINWVAMLLSAKVSRETLPPRESLALVPAPAKKQKDHAFGLAKALELLGVGVLEDVLKRGPSEGEQKNKSLAERKALSIVASTGWNCHSYKTVIFVDDVITSGGTARAAWRALGRPKSYEIWTLADRPALREGGGFVIVPP